MEQEYRACIDKAHFDPEFPERVLRELSLAQSGKGNAMKKPKNMWKIALIAAALVIALTVSAGAIILSNLEQARNDLRIDAPIPEWTEYEDAANADGTVRLISSLCSGDLLDAYFEVGPIDAETGKNLQENQKTGECGWSVDLPGFNNANDATQLSYDAESKTALVKLYMSADALAQLEELTVSLELDRNDGERVRYAPITVPLAQAPCLFADLACDFSAEGVSGTVTGVAIRAGMVEFSAVIDGVDPGEETADERHSRSVAYRAAAAEALDGAVLNFADGTSVRMADLPSPFAGWVLAGDELAPVEAGDFTLRRICAEAIDLSKLVSVTLGGTEYPLK